MATTKSTTPRSRSTSRTTTAARTTKTPTQRAKADDSIVARTGRTIKERPYTSAAIATGAVTVVAAAAAAGAFLASRRDKSFKEASEELSAKVKGGFATASETVRDGISSAADSVKDLGQRGANLFKGEGDDTGSATRSQQEIAEEALTLKETGTTARPIDEVSATAIKTGAIAY